MIRILKMDSGNFFIFSDFQRQHKETTKSKFATEFVMIETNGIVYDE